jgi:hypothetical protein
MKVLSQWRATRRDRERSRSQEAGAVALIFALFASVVFFGLAAIGVDSARWAIEVERVQKTADAAALAGVTFLPTDMTSARTTALAVAAKNGFTPSATVQITVVEGARPSQLKVTVRSLVSNQFGRLIGVPTTWVTRTGVADYTGPAPMGSPCNVFGNEPASQPSAALPTNSALPTPVPANCSSTPQFWATIEGPATDKVQGDRYMTSPCASTSTWSCASSKNSELRPEGYFWAVHVEAAAVGTPIDVQLYDPAFVFTQKDCSGISYTPATNDLNDYTTTDAKLRYRSTTSTTAAIPYCSGDYYPGGGSDGMDTTFTMREQTDTNDPMKAPMIPGCTKQFRGFDATPSLNNVTDTSGSYDKQLSRVWHQWISLCTFTPTRKGDWYIQVRTNVALPGSGGDANTNGKPAVVYPANNPAAGAATGTQTTGSGNNAFAMRAVPTDAAMRGQIAVSGVARMPIFQNATGSVATFNLIKALSNTKNQYIAFDFYDAADGSDPTTGGTIKVLPPVDALGSVKTASGIPGCRGALNTATYSSLTNCVVTVKPSTHDGQLQHMIVPIPNDYSCADTVFTGCWFRVQITFSGSDVSDITTWDANISGDPVRLVE